MNKENKKYIEGFEEYLKNKNLSAKTIRRHVSNAEFYINDYLANHYEDVDAIKGIDDFILEISLITSLSGNVCGQHLIR